MIFLKRIYQSLLHFVILFCFGGKEADDVFSKVTSRNNLFPKLVTFRKYTIKAFFKETQGI